MAAEDGTGLIAGLEVLDVEAVMTAMCIPVMTRTPDGTDHADAVKPVRY